MQKENRFWIKNLMLPILCFLLWNLDIDIVSNIGDFIKGFVIAVLIIIILWLVYGDIRSLHEKELDKDKKL